MKPSEIKEATNTELIARYAKVSIDRKRFNDLHKKADDECRDIYNELYKSRSLRAGLYIIDGRNVCLSLGNGLKISTPVFIEINDIGRKK